MQAAKTTKIHVSDATAMLALGGQLAQAMDGNTALILLQGELGAGKTTLMQGFLQGLGFKGRVKSPTYTLVEPYQINTITVYHFDFYRINKATELEFIGLGDYLAETAICAIEWPERAADVLPTADLVFAIEVLSSGRELTISAASPCGSKILERLLHATPTK